ncbi:hypothetical protein NT6N_36830 [Oceaniferula spumae]|uniref:Protein containing Coagulation factor 5/8 type n=1 Tax=Oceaniferula spumae TaxID=2979115 RepID=A0AAT9FRN0_9BACT
MNPLHSISASAVLATLAVLGSAPAQNQPIYQSDYLGKEQAMKSIQVPEGYKLELVLSDPEIKEPVWAVWDGNGVMYVAEMRTYMQDADATGENKPISRISRHEDTDGDGVYDKHSVFVDNLLLPRMILPLDDRLMVGVTNSLDLWTYRDSDGDGVADEKIKIYNGGRRGGNMEHQPSGLTWALDNWIYLTYESVRYRFTDGKLVKEKIPSGNGQWGLTQDDDGRLYYSRAGGENPALAFHQNPQYGSIGIKGELDTNFKKVFPIAQAPDFQGGPRRVNPDGSLNYFTGCAGQEIFRGDQLPSDLYGDLLIPEPVGRLIRRAKITRSDGMSVLSNATPGSEFIRTRDVNFRPVQTTTGPDGCLYIVDMHRGIIQQGNWTKPGSYLRGIIDKWDLAKNTSRGRIYRLVHKDHKPGPRPKMNSEKTADLVKYLDHSNGWWRDTAKRLIILREDRESVAPLLESIALNQKLKTQTRITALWTLDGMSGVKPELLAKLLADSEYRILTNAIRVSETWIKKGDPTVVAAIKKLANTTHAEIGIQLLNSIHYCGNPESLSSASEEIMSKHGQLPAMRANISFRKKQNKPAPKTKGGKKADKLLTRALQNGQEIYTQLCIECHGENGRGTPMAGQDDVVLAPALNSKRVIGSGDTLIRILLHGLQGPIDGKTYAAGIMPPQSSNNDQWIADVATYVRSSFGNKATMITPDFVANIRRIDAARKEMWTQKELVALEPKELTNRKSWKLSASHGESSLVNAVDGDPKSRYTTSKKMIPGMWLQIELPSAVDIERVVMSHKGSDKDFPDKFIVGFSLDGKTWKNSKPQSGTPSVSSFSTSPTKARYIRIKQLGTSKSYYWSIHELQLFGK